MNLGVKWGAIVTVAIAVVYLVMPQEKIDRAHESWLRLTNDSGQACLDYERLQLKDPDSARLLSAFTKGGTATIKYKARNSYGTYGQSEVQCAMSGNEVSSENTELVRESARLSASTKETEKRIVCLQRVIALQRQELRLDDARDKVRQTPGCEDFH